MALNITVRSMPSLAQSFKARRDIPVFIGDSFKTFREPLKFLDASKKTVALNCSKDVEPINISANITAYKRATGLIDISTISNGGLFIPINSNTINQILNDSLLVVCNESSQLIDTYYVRKIIRDLELPSYIIGIQIDRPIKITANAKHFCVLSKGKVDANVSFNSATRIVSLDYVLDNFGIGIQAQFSHIEYGIVNSSDYFLAIGNEQTGIQDVDTIRVDEIDGKTDCIVIPCNEKTPIEDIEEKLNKLRDGYYIVPITKSEELTRSIVAAIIKSGR